MLRHRVIPMLLVADGGLVKTTKFEEPKYVGDPINAIRIFNEKEVDELALLDIRASAESSGPNLELVKDVASECFMPLAYGGGIRDLADAKAVFALGVEKVIIRTAAARDLSVLQDIVAYAGASSVTVSIDIQKSRLGKRRVFAPGSSRDGKAEWLAYLGQAIDVGAGEVLLNSVDRDGTMSGMDLEAIRQASDASTVPLVAAGGVGSLRDIRDGVDAGADAVAVGSFFVFHGPRRAVLISYPSYAELTSLLGQDER